MGPLSVLLPLFQPNVNVTFQNWHGGRIYFENLGRILSELPEADRPAIYVLTDGTVDLPVLQALLRQAAVEGIFRPDGYPIFLKPRLMAALVDAKHQPKIGEIQKLLAQVDVIFPVLQTDVVAPDGLHWIPDFQHKYLPEMFDAAELARRDRNFATMVRERRFVLLSSRAAEADCRKFYPDMRARTFVWSFSSSLSDQVIDAAGARATFELPEKFLLAPNQFWKHKDHGTLFRAVKMARDQGHDIAVACTGSPADYRNPGYYDELRGFVTASGLADKIHFLGMVPHGTLGRLFREAAAVVQPSRFEGWSTVVEDAKALGRPLIVSDLPVHLEQAESAVSPFHFFKAGDPADLAQKLATHWPRLSPGPDAVMERAAQQRRRERETESAQAFMAIARDIRAARAARMAS